MEVIVIGSGVIGLTSAWYLAKEGHKVTVIDRQDSSGKETSFANAGQISYGYSSPWAAPGIPVKALKWLTQEHAPLKVKPSLSPALIQWATQMLSNCSPAKYAINKSRMLRIANYSRDCLTELRETENLDYEGRQQGTLQVFRDPKQLEAIQQDMKLLKESGIEHSLLDVEECIKVEPGLESVRDKLVGGLYLPGDETGDCHKFCLELTERAKALGVEFKFNTEVYSLNRQGSSLVSINTSVGELKADAFVLATGSYSTKLLKQINIDIPVYPVKGYSLTLPIVNADKAPTSTVMDETYKVAMTRFDDRIRIAGTAELAGFNFDIPEKRKATIDMVIKDLFPEAGDHAKAEYWTGLRPMTPDGTPIIGKTPVGNLYTNTGHGTLGWTMACGSGKILASVVSGKAPEVESDDLSVSRYQ
ncbi:D-amino acid dehydrogenase [Vibrio pelagius]|uniref:D-amino acid dehydrogenase n=1 Tax=Vibrio pelagius TaxID=28169 RepID=A0ABY5G4E8_VIBPE|nr:D-amino acid dehydrogenase [Vibrio pelagius]UTT85023.1 D-amino acid dehydrogenase [Vibrio pelagius]